jgi:glycosyltransferase involved in cell wall biosynthesis
MAQFFKGWPRESLAQFYIQNATPDFSLCGNYYRITDKDALYALLKGGKDGKIAEDIPQTDPSAPRHAMRPRRTPLRMILRDFVWRTGRWKSKSFYSFIDGFSPEAVILQAGHSVFMFRLAAEISESRNIPLIIYNSEGYYFNKKSFFLDAPRSSLYPVFHRRLQKSIRKALAQSEYCIYSCEKLERKYKEVFEHRSATIMMSAELCEYEEKTANIPPVVSYLGNLGIKRHESLIEISEIMQQINADWYLDVYGKITGADAFAILRSKGIRYHGFVPYETVAEAMRRSDILVHAESFDKKVSTNWEFGFSAKIADSLACGVPLLLYAPETFACCEYLIREAGAHTVTERSQLYTVFEKLFGDEAYRKQHISKARQLAQANHNSETNQKRFLDIIQEAVREYK